MCIKEHYQEHCHIDVVRWLKGFLSDDLELTLVGDKNGAVFEPAPAVLELYTLSYKTSAKHFKLTFKVEWFWVSINLDCWYFDRLRRSYPMTPIWSFQTASVTSEVSCVASILIWIPNILLYNKYNILQEFCKGQRDRHHPQIH